MMMTSRPKASEAASARHRPDEHAGIGEQRGHPDPVAENRAARERRGRVDRDDGNRSSLVPEEPRKSLHQGALASPRRAGHPEPPGPAGAREELVQHPGRVCALVLDDRQQSGAGPLVALSEEVEQLVSGQHRHG
jgi:hypothetical protein